MNDATSAVKMTDTELQDLVIESDSGARRPTGVSAKILFFTALAWSLFQLWIASPLVYNDFFVNVIGIKPINSTDARYIHLAFALVLAYISYPAFKKSPRNYIPSTDWICILFGLVSVLYLFVYSDALAHRSGRPTTIDIVISIIGVLLVIEAARRALGKALVIVASVFLLYTFTGNMAFMPDLIAHKGQDLSKVASHQWLSSEGIFGIAIGVSTDFVFLFVLFGALLEKAGAGNYFIKVAFSLLGHSRGGPAKTAVLASAMTGMISGSSIANVVTTGTFTIPLMRKVGFSREKSGAIEVAAAVDGQIMPPVMGTAAFLMVEYIGIPYSEVVKAAFLPAVLSYVALFYIVHLEAVKANMVTLKRNKPAPTWLNRIISYLAVLIGFIILSGLVYYGIGWIKVVFGDYAKYIIASAMLIAYLSALYYASKSPPLEIEDPNEVILKLPELGSTVKTGLHYVLPIIVLVWCLMVESLSPALSAFWATSFLIFILVTQRPILAFFRKSHSIKLDAKTGYADLIEGLVMGSRNMVGVGIATAAAGIIVGAISLTGVGQVLTEVVEHLAGGSFFLVLVYTAIISLILGMGLPTTANYIVVSSLMVPVIVELGAQNGMLIPLIAVHLFVFYFGIMADVTPPVGLASFAAAAISGGDPMKTGWQGFTYSIRTGILPFMFIYNTDLLLIGVDNFIDGLIIFAEATVAILLFVAACQGYFVVRSKKYESVILFALVFTMFRPDFWVDMITPPYEKMVNYKIEKTFDEAKVGQKIKIGAMGENNYGDPEPFYVFIDVKADWKDKDSLKNYGIILKKHEGQVFVESVVLGSQAEKDGFDFDYEITSLELSQEQMSRDVIYLVAICVLFGVILLQRARKSEIMSLENA